MNWQTNMTDNGARREKIVRRTVAFLAHFSGLNAFGNHCSRLLMGPKLTVLAYHRVNDHSGDESPYTVTCAQLERQLEILKNRCCIVGFADVLDMVAGRRTCEDSAVITFDDGYRDNFENAVPILEKYGAKACFFLTTKLIDRGSTECVDSPGTARFPGMTWAQAKALHERGFELGAHTRTHPTLPSVSLAEASLEIRGSKERMQEELGTPIRYFAYPGGKAQVHYDEVIRRVVADEFDICCTTNRGRNSLRGLDPLEVRRICVQRWWSPFYFQRELDGTFDFVGSRTFTTRKG